MSFLGFTSAWLGSEVSCPRTLPRKNPEDPVQLEPRTPELRVKHFATEPHRTTPVKKEVIRKQAISPFQTVFSTHLGELYAIFMKIEIVVCKLFKYGIV